MRKMIDLPDALAEQAEALAMRRSQTLSSLVEEGLRMVLADADRPAEPLAPLPTWGPGEWLVDLSDKDAVWEILDADDWK